MKRKLHDIYKGQIKINKSWLDSYKDYVPKIVSIIKKGVSSEDKNGETFNQFFSSNSSVSNLGQGAISNDNIAVLKQYWSELEPHFQKLANNPNCFLKDEYQQIDKKIKEHTTNHRKIATHRLIATVQPHMFCTIIKDDDLRTLYKYLHQLVEGEIPQYVQDWYESSKQIRDYFRKNITDEEDEYLIDILPWHFKEYFDSYKRTIDMENKLVESYKQEVIDNKNLILSGAPGTGKSYLAKLIAASIIGCDKDELIGSKQFQFVQFHPSYDYTDFVEGLRPYQKEGSNDIGFKLEPGIFYSFCQDALKDKENNYVFVIDEINRGEISKIFGELFFSVEPSYRGPKGNVTTQFANLHKEENEFDKTIGNGKNGNFFVPENIFIIATMNGIDRSVENLDFAFRRRFPTEYIKWDDTLDSILETLTISFKEEAKTALTRLNQAITEEEELGEDYTIGGAYLLHLKDTCDANSSLEAFWNSYLGTIINEYLKGLLSQKELKEMVTSLKNEFLEAKTDKQ